MNDKLNSGGLGRIRDLVAWGGVLRILSIGIGLLNTVILTRILPIEQFGLYVFAYTAMTIVSVPSRAGIPQLVLRTTAYALKNEERSNLGARWKWATRFTIAVSALSMVALAALVLPSSGIRMCEYLVAAALIPVISLANTRTSALRALNRPLLGQMPELVLRPGLFLLLLLVAVVILDEGMIRLVDVLLLNLAVSFITLLLTVWMLRKVAREKGVGGTSQPAEKIPGGLRAALALGTVATFTALNNNLDIMMLNYLRSPDEVAIYRPASQIASIVLFGMQVINMIIQPRIAALYKAGALDRLEALTKKSTLAGFVYAAGITLILALSGQFILGRAYGEEYAGGYLVLVILSLAHTLNASFGAAVIILNMAEHEDDALIGIVSAVGINVITGVVLISLMGLTGAAISTFLAVAFYKVYLSRKIWKRLGIKNRVF